MLRKDIILEMNVQMTIIDNLGIKMYSNIEAVLSELISNAYDADSTEVSITIPEGLLDNRSKIIIKDNGSGISLEEINSTYLNLGRNRRDDPETAITPIFNRKVMGRKGIGKLSAFGISNTLEIATRRDFEETIFLLNLDDIRKTPPTEKYKPAFQSKPIQEKDNGTTITLLELSRKRGFSIPQLRIKLARRFSCLDSNFKLIINGIAITPQERNLKDSCEIVHNFSDELLKDDLDLKVTGWIGTYPYPVSSDIASGIVIMVRGKLAQEPTYFDVPSAGWITMARSYIIGEIHANFLDNDNDEDLILTNRSSIDWSSDYGQILLQWGQKEVKRIANAWGENQKNKKEKVIREDPEFSDWLTNLTPPQQKVANKVINALTADGSLPDERVKELTHYVKNSFDFEVFKDLALAISTESNVEDRRLIELFHEWDIIEAREVFKVAQGRLLAIQQLEKMIITNAREVPEIHQFLGNYPWILDPSWTIAHNEVYLSTLLKKHFPESDTVPEKNRRIDFVCIGAGDTIHVVELKRPKQKIGKDELSQLEEYVAFIRQNLGNSPNQRSYRGVSGYIIGEDIKDDFYTRDKIETLAMNRMYVRKYADLLSMAQRLHKEFFEKMKVKN